MLKLNSISVSDCRKWVEAIYRAGADYCVLELGEHTPDELIDEFTASCRKRKMYVGLYSKCASKNRIEHLLSNFGKIDYLMLDEAETSEGKVSGNIPERLNCNVVSKESAGDGDELKRTIFSLAPDIYLRGPREVGANVFASHSTAYDKVAENVKEERKDRYEYDYAMADIKPWHEAEMVINSAENIIGIYNSVMAEGKRFLLYISVIRTRNHYAAQLQCLNDLGQKLAPKRQKLKVSKKSLLIIAAILLLIFSTVRVLYVNKVYGQYQKKLVGYRSRFVSAPVGKYSYTVMSPGFPRFRNDSGGLYYAKNGALTKIDGDSLNIYVKVTPYLRKPVDYEVYVSVIKNVAADNLSDEGRTGCVLLLDNELNPAAESDAEALAIYEEYYGYICEQIRVGNEYFGIEYAPN